MKIRGLLMVALASSVSSSVSFAQNEASPAFSEIEILPDYVVRRIDADQANEVLSKLSTGTQPLRGIVASAKRWPANEPIRVCFFGGSRQLRERIATVAKGWEFSSSPIRFDFGNIANPNLCGGSFAHIRVGYNQRGYWSLLGQDSVIYANQYEQSLNLARFDMGSVPDDEFRRVVLHEFGHAIGFQHEHQNPIATCESEYDWPQVYAYLSGSPNFWSRETVDHNMRSRPYMNGDVTTEFDPKSIMLYSFPAQFYRNGTNSRCYAATNDGLSPGDRQTLLATYGQDRSNALASLEAAAAKLTASDRSLLNDRLGFFRLKTAVKGSVVGDTELNAATPVFAEAIRRVDAQSRGD